MSVTAIGSIALDSLIIPSGEFQEVLGGSASHFATSCSLFCKDLAIVGVVGHDFPREHIQYFQDRGVNIDGLKVEAGKTFRWKGRYEHDQMDQAMTLDTQLNVFENFRPELSESSANPDFLFLGNIHPALQYDVTQKVTARLKILDTMNLWIQTAQAQLREVLSRIDILIFNDGEARLFTGSDNLLDAGRKVLELGPRAVIMKRGEHGALLISRDDVFSVPGFPVEKVIDPTGAGDSFAGGFVGSLAESGEITKESLRRAVAYGNVMGSFNVQGVGVEVLSKATREMVEARYKSFQELVRF